MRYDQGLFEDVCQSNPAEAQAIIADPDVVNVTIEAAQKSTVVLRDRENLLPLPTDQKVMLIEQVFPTQQFSNNMYSHPGLLWESMSKHSDNVACVEINNVPTPHDLERIERRIDESDLIVMTNYYYHKAASSISEQVREIIKRGKRVVVVANSPFEFAAPEDFDSVILCYQPGGPEHMDAVADLLFGK